MHCTFTDDSGHKLLCCVAKMPWTTNQQYNNISGLEALLRKLKKLSNDFYGAIPYAFLQPTLPSRVEYKIACFNKVPLYICGVKGKGRNNETTQSNLFNDKSALFQFAKKAIFQLKAAKPQFSCDGLVRVDIVAYKEKLYVNEFEGLEAGFHMKGCCTEEISLKQKLASFWERQIRECIAS